jgi:hypothetical protein
MSRSLRLGDSLRSPHDPMERDVTDAATFCYKSGIVLFKGCPNSAINDLKPLLVAFIPCSHKLVNYPNPEPVESNPLHRNRFMIHINIIIWIMFTFLLQVCSSLNFRTQILNAFAFPPPPDTLHPHKFHLTL